MQVDITYGSPLSQWVHIVDLHTTLHGADEAPYKGQGSPSEAHSNPCSTPHHNPG